MFRMRGSLGNDAIGTDYRFVLIWKRFARLKAWVSEVGAAGELMHA